MEKSSTIEVFFTNLSSIEIYKKPPYTHAASVNANTKYSYPSIFNNANNEYSYSQYSIFND